GPSCPHFTGSPRIFVTDTRLIDPSAPGSRSEERAAHQKRTLVVLVIMQVIGAVGVGVAVRRDGSRGAGAEGPVVVAGRVGGHARDGARAEPRRARRGHR